MRAAAFILVSLVAAPAFARAAPLIELVAEPIPVSTVHHKRGSLPVRVSLGFDRALILNPQPARNLGLKPFPIIGKMTFKNPQLPGGEATIRGNFMTFDVGGTGPARLPTIWIDKDIVPQPDAGIVSIMALDADKVRISNPVAPTSGIKSYVVRRAGRNDVHFEWKLGRETVRVIFDFTSEATMLNAGAAAVLEREGLVRRSGQVGLWSPVPGVKLPVELLLPVSGAELFGIPLLAPHARISRKRAAELDARAAQGISGLAEDDPDAIVVTAEKEKGRRRAPWMLIGRDVLRYCTTILLDRPGKAWELSCAFPGR